MRSAQLLAAVFALSSVSSAWTSPEDMSVKGISDFMLLPRQDNNGGGNNNNPDNNNNNPDNNGGNNGGNNASPKSTKSSATKTDSSTSKGSSESSKPTSKSGDDDPKTTDSQPTRTSFGNTIFPGTVKLKTPAPTSGPGLFKIGDHVTFGFNYSGVKAPLSAVDVLVSCTINDHMYTVTANMSTNPSESVKVVWDTKKDASGAAPLPVASYTLVIKDSDNSVSATADPGYLQNYMMYMFAMYTPQPYTPLSDFDCATCEVNGGIANVPAHQTVTLMLAMTSLTVLSFTWFASNRFGVL